MAGKLQDLCVYMGQWRIYGGRARTPGWNNTPLFF